MYTVGGRWEQSLISATSCPSSVEEGVHAQLSYHATNMTQPDMLARISRSNCQVTWCSS